MRSFEGGATRDTDDAKLSYFKCLDPGVLQEFLTYMQRHRVQADGGLRDWDNWQAGMPQDVYMDSLVRHVLDLWMMYRDSGTPVSDDRIDTCCAVMFNVMGLLRELHREG